MATDLFFLDDVSGLNIDGAAVSELAMGISTRGNQTAGAGGFVNTVTGPTSGLQFFTGGTWSTTVWFSPPLAAITISGTITFNLWMSEANMTDNAGPQVKVERCDNAGNVISTIVNSERGVELGTTMAVNNWTAAPTSTTLAAGDRLKFTVYANDAGGTMATGGSVTFNFDRDTAGVSGDSYVRFTETIADAPIVVSASDTVAATIGDASVVLPVLAGADTLAGAMSEGTSAIAGTVAAADTEAMTLADTSALLVQFGTADTLVAGIQEGASISIPVAGSDTAAGAITEATATMSLPVAVDTLALTLTEGTAVILGVVGRSDTLATSITETQVSALTVAVADILAMALGEASVTLIPLIGTDTLALGITDAGAVVVTVPKVAVDTLAAAITEVSAVFGLLDRVDTLAMTLTEVVATQAALAGSDDLTVALTEVVVAAVGVSTTDTLALALDEANALMAVVGRSDSLAWTLAEAVAVAVTLSRTDDLASTMTESQQSVLMVGRSDSLAMLGADASLVRLFPAAADTIALVAGFEIVNTLKAFLTAVDTVGLTGTEAPSAVLAKISRSDTGALVLVDVSATQGQPYSSDVIRLLADPTMTLTGTMAAADVGGLGVLDASGINTVVARTDSMGLAAVDAAAIQAAFTASDTAALAVGEGYLLVGLVPAADVLALGVIETRALGGDFPGLIFVEASDVLALIIIGQSDRAKLSIRGQSIFTDMRPMEEAPTDSVMEDTPVGTMG